jgi:hypothetical protein
MSILVGITFGSFQILNSIGMYLFIGVGLSLIGLFVFVETNVIKLMIDLSLFKIRSFLGGNIAIARGAFTLIMTFYLQGPTMRLSPLDAGLYLLPISIALSILDEIKKIPGVKDVWFTDDRETNLFVEIEVNSLQQGLKIESDIKKMTYVKATELSMSTVQMRQ